MKLLACPFCNSDKDLSEEWEYSKIYNQHFYWVHCEDCAVNGPRCESMSDAVDEWNTRHYPTCEQCRFFIIEGEPNSIEDIVYKCNLLGINVPIIDFGCIHYEPKEEP